MRKKILAVILSAGMLLGVCQTNVFAANMVIKSENDVYNYDFEKDKTFDITFVVENNPGIQNGNIKVHYDPSVIQAVESDNYELEGYYTFTNNSREERFFETDFINSQINRVASTDGNGVNYPSGTADGKKTASEIGYIILSNFTTSIDSTGNFEVMTGDKKLFTMRFKMLKAGSTDVVVQGIGVTSSTEKLYFCSSAGPDSNISGVQSIAAKVTLNDKTSGSSDKTTTETSTEASTETTTNKSSSSSSGGGSTGSKNNDKADSEETSTEAVTTSESKDENASSSNKLTFEDIAPYPWAVNAIETLASKGIINGVGNNKFNPAANVKRADFLIMLVNALDLEAEVTENFADVSKDKYYYNAVGIAKSLGIANGMGNNMYDPEAYISRQDMMVLAKRTIELKYSVEEADTSVLDRFDDKDTISAYAVDSLAAMVNAGIVNGTGNNIEPKANTTRAQAAVIIYNITETDFAE